EISGRDVERAVVRRRRDSHVVPRIAHPEADPHEVVDDHVVGAGFEIRVQLEAEEGAEVVETVDIDLNRGRSEYALPALPHATHVATPRLHGGRCLHSLSDPAIPDTYLWTTLTQSRRYMTWSPTGPRSGWSKASGTVVRIENPMDSYRWMALRLVS